ncbi:hypothetical protein BC749_10940 [Flavobacterium araucananum]|uniref:Uncharacterized protein n=1 Tax=Flavobacterium araucananum TaxID=946678 RepID=A0A227P547_9FLAO|nr:hypothetical protein [Flavobacterium araucananum]OXG05051.1 hypothetical protein B0A64_13540 [Flavobacterium araucananum]PWJ96764.1 hypothetical protein BC749_10940 [Flavobacterium araucananum]
MKDKVTKIIPIWSNRSNVALQYDRASTVCKASREELIKAEFRVIHHRLEQYVSNKNDVGKVLKVSDFVKMYLRVLAISQNALAFHFKMKCSTLDQHLSGERKLSAALILKLSVLTHVRPELWHGVEIKNEQTQLHAEKNNWELYEQFDYRNLITGG